MYCWSSYFFTGKYKLNAVSSNQFPLIDNHPFRHKMTFCVVASLVKSRWLKHGYVCLSKPILHKKMDLTIFMDINPNPGPSNCLSYLYLNARSVKAFAPHRSRSVRPGILWYLWSGLYLRNMAWWYCVKRRTNSRLFNLSIFQRDRACRTGGGVFIA